ncbi:MAG: NAD(P)-dependent oxidoreductase [Candidatus Dojkabacteria bacterium]
MGKKKLTVFGGTGKSGKFFVECALERGYELKLLVRNPEKLTEEVRNASMVDVVVGDALSPENVSETIAASDAVVVLLGHTRNSPANLQEQAIALIIDEMRKYEVKRLIDLTGAGVRTEGDKPSLIDRFANLMLAVVDRARLVDGARHVEIIKQCKDLDWTVIRTGLQRSEQGNGSYKLGMVGTNDTGFAISRGNLAKAMLDVLEDREYIGKILYVSD